GPGRAATDDGGVPPGGRRVRALLLPCERRVLSAFEDRTGAVAVAPGVAAPPRTRPARTRRRAPGRSGGRRLPLPRCGGAPVHRLRRPPARLPDVLLPPGEGSFA